MVRRRRSPEGLAPWALGSDTGGSIKQPASLCGLVGLRPTYGTVSRYGIVAFASSLDQVGPFAKTVRDCALLYSVIAGRDPLDSTTVELPEPIELPTAESLEGVRIGVADGDERGRGHRGGGRRRLSSRAIEIAESLGAEVGEVSLPRSVEYGLACYYLIAPAEASSNLARYDGVRYGHRSKDAGDLLEMYMRTRWEGFGAEPKRRIMLGTYALSAGYYEAYYGQAQKLRTLIRDEHADALASYRRARQPDLADCGVPPRGEGRRSAHDVPLRHPHDPILPGRVFPASTSPVACREGMPVGLQLVGGSSPRTRSSASATLSSVRLASTTCQNACGDLGTRHRARDPRPAEDADEDVLPLRERLG